MTQVRTGRGFEYGLAYELKQRIQAKMINDQSMRVARAYFNQCSSVEQQKIKDAAYDAILRLTGKDTRLKQHECRVRIQSDMRGAEGDVRDVIVETPQGELGISTKNRNFAVKNPRLSDRIDFGKKWMGNSNSQAYWDEVGPIFKELRQRKNDGELWGSDRKKRYYVPLLQAFQRELKRIYREDKTNVATNMLHYLLGKYDYYKIIKTNGKVVIQSFNINGTLKWGSKVPLPKRIINTEMERQTTLIVRFDAGWELSFRIHSAEKRIQPSLKFDVQIIGLPQRLATHEDTIIPRETGRM